MGDLKTIFTFKTVATMSAELVDELTKEPRSVVEEREKNRRKLETLRDVLRICNKHVDKFGNQHSVQLFIHNIAITSLTVMHADITYQNIFLSSDFPDDSNCDSRLPKNGPLVDSNNEDVIVVVSKMDELHLQAIPGYPSPPKTPSRLSPNRISKSRGRSTSQHRVRSSSSVEQLEEAVPDDSFGTRPTPPRQPRPWPQAGDAMSGRPNIHRYSAQVQSEDEDEL